MQGSIAYFGTYAIDEAKGTISLRHDGSTYRNWDGDTQERLVSVSGNEVNSWVTPEGLPTPPTIRPRQAASVNMERAQLTQILDLFAEDGWRNVYAGELEVRPAFAPRNHEGCPPTCPPKPRSGEGGSA